MPPVLSGHLSFGWTSGVPVPGRGGLRCSLGSDKEVQQRAFCGSALCPQRPLIPLGGGERNCLGGDVGSAVLSAPAEPESLGQQPPPKSERVPCKGQDSWCRLWGAPEHGRNESMEWTRRGWVRSETPDPEGLILP